MSVIYFNTICKKCRCENYYEWSLSEDEGFTGDAEKEEFQEVASCKLVGKTFGIYYIPQFCPYKVDIQGFIVCTKMTGEGKNG